MEFSLTQQGGCGKIRAYVGVRLNTRAIPATEQRRTEQYLELRNQIAYVLAQWPPMPEAASRVVQAICNVLGWQVGEFWLVDPSTGVLRHFATWHEPSQTIEPFLHATTGITFAPGVGLPGRAWANRRPVWFVDAPLDPAFMRCQMALDVGLHAAFAIPVIARDAVLGVMTFFHRERRDPDPPLLETLTAISTDMALAFERARAAETLAASESQLRAIVGTAVDGIIVIDETGHIESFNPAAERLFGYTAKEAIGQNVALLMPSPHKEEHGTYLATYLRTGQHKIIGIGREMLAQRKDGTIFPIHLSVSEMRVHDRHMFTGIVTDLTELKRMQEEVIRSRSLAAIGETAASIAHEIRNPLAALSGSLQLLRNEISSEDPRRTIFEETLGQIRRLDTIVHQLLLLAKPWTPVKQVQDVRDIAARVIAMVREQASFERVRLAVEEGGAAQASVDASLLEQVLWNLLLNAAQAMPEGGDVRVSVSAADQEVRICVADTGPGMPAAIMAKLFQPFFTTKADGNGLGLSICRKIVEAHGGTLSVDSKVGKGTKVTCRLPRR